ncbi:MAG: sigma 54-interacting transcriptional regulator, partial [Pseudomonadota bacterium]|nr:sigma 54-interacting transcriptional regulator [Pseudomonadota bacterium]
VIAATNRNLEELVLAGEFREDLFYRLSVFPIEVPPLRRRREDLVPLAQHFLEQSVAEFGRESQRLTRAQVDDIEAYGWPGNVRELKNVIERAVILSTGNTLRLDLSLPDRRRSAGLSGHPTPEHDRVLTEKQMRELQKQNIVSALKKTGWRVSGKNGAAELLGVKPTTLADRIKSFGLRRP